MYLRFLICLAFSNVKRLFVIFEKATRHIYVELYRNRFSNFLLGNLFHSDAITDLVQPIDLDWCDSVLSWHEMTDFNNIVQIKL